METNFKKIAIKDFKTHPFTIFDKQHTLIASGTVENGNMMTASWGAFGTLWNKPVAIIFVRPSRYTWEFIEKTSQFSLNFFTKEYKSVLDYCGNVSGRKENKILNAGLTPALTPQGYLYFTEAELVLSCRSLYRDELVPERFRETFIHQHYRRGDYHSIFIGQIIEIYEKSLM